jgi:hypothetical protein
MAPALLYSLYLKKRKFFEMVLMFDLRAINSRVYSAPDANQNKIDSFRPAYRSPLRNLIEMLTNFLTQFDTLK